LIPLLRPLFSGSPYARVDWLKLGRLALSVLAILGGAAGLFGWGEHCGKKSERARANAEAIQAKAAAEQLYRQKEIDNEKRIGEIRAKYAGAAAAEAESDRHVASDLRAGVRVLRFKAARCPVAAGAGAAAARIDETQGTQLAPEVAESLYSIAADGDAAIRQLSALQSWARSAVELCSGNSPRLSRAK
jgi:hypothetical protein